MRMCVKPKDSNSLVRDPKSRQPLPKEGKEVPRNSFWIRRLMGGDVILANRKKLIKKTDSKDKGE